MVHDVSLVAGRKKHFFELRAEFGGHWYDLIYTTN